MTDETTADAQAADAAQQAQAATPAAQAVADTETISLEEARKLRSEAASLRKRLKALDDAEAQRQQASLTEQEKLAKQAEKLQADLTAAQEALRQERARLAIGRAAAQLGIDPALAESLALPQLEYNDDGAPMNTEKVLRALLTQYPYLATGAGVALGNGQRQEQRQAIDPKNPPRLGQPGLWKK